MDYFLLRGLFYTFLMQEITEGADESWRYVAKHFGIKPKQIKEFDVILKNGALKDLTTVEDINMYKNYLNGFCKDKNEFGMSLKEQTVLEAKALAMHKISELFGDMSVKGNRLRSLSHNYERDHTGAVLYALRLLCLNGNGAHRDFAEDILDKELKNGKNSDAGIILLLISASDKSNDKSKERLKDVMAQLSVTPDMLLRPDVLKRLTKRFGADSGANLAVKRAIGF